MSRIRTGFLRKRELPFALSDSQVLAIARLSIR
jgi:hypothetical protein